MPRPALRWTRCPRRPDAVVLVLHGGQPRSDDPVTWWQPPVLRMLPFAWAVARAGRGRLAVVRLRLAVRGWNDDAPVRDARWALEQVRSRYPGLPVGLLGHSLGGRTALHLGSDPDVAAIVTVATWLEEDDVVAARPGTPALLVHGDRDEVTSPECSEVATERLRAGGARVTHVVLPGGDHAMLHRPWVWHGLAARFLRDVLLGRRRPARGR